MKDPLYCPRCLSPLVVGEGTRIYQTLVEHVSDPNGTVYPKEYFICSNNDCPTRIDDDFWEWYGDYHYSKNYAEDFFFLNCNKALNSHSREFTIQQKKKKRTFLHLVWFKVYIESSPIPDKVGLNIVGYKRKIKACTRARLKDSWIEYISGISMLFFCLDSFNQSLNKFLENPQNKYSLNYLIENMERSSCDRRWWSRLSVWIVNRMYPELKKTLLSIKNKN